ncbi:MAG: ClbS/DfsB family four-helix bundle protein [Anaerolineae bacterium]|nr:MAG: ClbS/DfsB family four-helix bundle protein [Anaerolineae bacterium]
MSEFVNKEELLRRLDESYRQLRELLTRILPQKTMEAGVEGTWSVKDILAHLIGWQQFALMELQAAFSRQPRPSAPADVDLFNAQQVEANRTFPYDVVLGNWRQSVQSIIDAVNSIPDGEFMPNSKLQQWLGETINDTLANNTYEHWDEHRVIIEAWLAGA